MKRIVLLFFAVLCLLTSCETMNSAKNEVVSWFDSTESDEYKALQNKYDKLVQEKNTLENDYSNLQWEYNQLVNRYNSYQQLYSTELSNVGKKNDIINRAKDAVQTLKKDFHSFRNGWRDEYDIERDIESIENKLDGWR